MGPKKSPKKKADKKRSRLSSSTGEDDEDSLYLELMDLIRKLQESDKAKADQITDLQSKLNQASAEISSLRTEVKGLVKSLEFTQHQQDEAKERIERCKACNNRP